MQLSERIAAAAYRQGLIFRAFADNILGFAPALCYGAVEFELLHGTLDELLAQPDVRAALAA